MAPVRTRNMYGPPGTGKTTSCVNQVKEWLSEGVFPHRIGYFAFTKVAAEESKRRIKEQSNALDTDFRWFRTLHSAAYQLAGVRHGGVATNQNVEEFAKEIGIPYNPWLADIDELDENNIQEGNLLMTIWDFGRNRTLQDRDEIWDVAPQSLRARVERQNYVRFVTGYEAWKSKKALVDFTDMIRIALDRGDGSGCTHVVIDEAQDLTPLQWEFANLISDGAAQVLRAGDDDQALYSFAGARSSDFVEIDGEPIVLAQSYRIPRSVHDEAIRLIGRNRQRVAKEYRPREEAGTFIRRQQTVAPPIPTEGSVAFLYRNKKHLREQADALLAALVPFASNRYPAPLSNRVAIAGLSALLSWEQTGRATHEGALAVVEMVETGYAKRFARYGSKSALSREARSRPWGETEDLGLTPEGMAAAKRDPVALVEGVKGIRRPQVEYLRKLLSRHGPDVFRETPRVTLTTVHGSKGAEWDHVFVSQDASQTCQDGESENPEEETRAKYVAITRAKQSCTILAPKAEGGWSI